MADVKAVQVFIDNHHKKCVAALQQIAQLADTGSELHRQRFQPNGEGDGESAEEGKEVHGGKE
jgi:hypothetical protein